MARCSLVTLLLTMLTSTLALAQGSAGAEWPHYGRDAGCSKYSPLDQIGRGNVKDLRIAWRWSSADDAILKAHPKLRTWIYEATPILIEGVLYVSTSLSQVAAIDPGTGKTLWVHDPKSYEAGTPANMGFVHRGVASWSDGKQRRIYIGTGDAQLIALDARTGQPCEDFGTKGRIDLTEGLSRPVQRALYSVTSPPVVCRDTVVVGSSVLDYPLRKDMPPGDVRGYDVRTGKLRWTFHAVPQGGEFGADTWEKESWKFTGAANVWTIMSADEELGYVYLPFSTPSNDWYGGQRLGAGLFGETLVCVEAATGKRVWHFQAVHHGLWDYDLPAAATLLDIPRPEGKIKALAQVSKQAFVYVLDRVTGKPIWPIEERPVPQSKAPGEKSWPTQPFPTKPAPVDRQGVTEADLIDFTPALRKEAKAILDKYDYGPLFTPPSERGAINLPGWAGGPSWAGAAFDPETGYLYVTSITSPISVTLTKPPFILFHATLVGQPAPLSGPQGLPLFKPPWGRITAIDLKTGDHAWMSVMGEGPRQHPALKDLKLPPLGWPRRGHMLLTKSLLFVGQEGVTTGARPSDSGTAILGSFANDQPALRAYDKKTGTLLADIVLPANVNGAPMTYQHNGKQYVVMPVGGANLPAELVAVALP